MIEGILDCYHGDTVDLAAFKAGGGLAVFLKATQGTSFVDPKFVPRLMQATALKLLVGAYHFCDASNPVLQVQHFLRLAGSVPGLKLAIDVESNSMDEDTVTISQAAACAFLIERAMGALPVVYIGRYGPDGEGTGLPSPVLSQCPLWLPRYTSLSKLRPKDLPKGWTQWRLWQYTDSPLDRNRFNGTEVELRAWWNQGNGSAPNARKTRRSPTRARVESRTRNGR